MALATLTQVKDYMGISVDKSKPETDDLISDLIDRVSSIIEIDCDRTFASTERTEYYSGEGLSYLYTKEYPITSVSGVWEDSTWSWGSSTEISSGSYRISENERKVIFYNTSLIGGTENIKIIYTAGYATIPYDLTHVCIEETVRIFKHKNDPGVYSKNVGEDSVERHQLDFLPTTTLVVDRYRRKGVV